MLQDPISSEPTPVPQRRRTGRVLASLLVGACVLAGSYYAYDQRYTISNWIQTQQFEPSAEVATLEEHLQLTTAGSLVFRSTHPEIIDRDRFNKACAGVDHREGGHVVGCYSHKHAIYLFRVNDSRISGIVETTAAHELLHAAWAQLKNGERESLQQQLLSFYEERKAADPALAERMSVYEHLSETSFANELHSVLGTEVSDLPKTLETHYSSYFKDRGAILSYFNGYHSVFSDLQAEAEQLQANMDGIKSEYESRRASFEDAVRSFNADAEAFRKRNDEHFYADDPAAFYRESDLLKQRRDSLENERLQLEGLASDFETKRQRLLELSETSVDLNRKLDSSLDPLH
ncbi:hypothetical protein [Canibacter zhoujuaniae]|uniref:hypothetical protein n=1 Tax=Canibacter zhoujuaniae TaxID=2708343 RepID=UPI001421636F|nr:hypothetical protein [Canibacter zhoujuaniae]